MFFMPEQVDIAVDLGAVSSPLCITRQVKAKPAEPHTGLRQETIVSLKWIAEPQCEFNRPIS